ncbi:MAG TPA: rhodanese-like domain-containing protein, partial [Bdellovibrio sp.]|nr:rhodanese-like domain-containing protein [Bdellovibrio sp.]
MRLLILALVSVLGFVACQQKPTKVTTKEPVLSGNMTAEKVMAGHPVILDVRSPFDFNLAHVPGAINVRWE